MLAPATDVRAFLPIRHTLLRVLRPASPQMQRPARSSRPTTSITTNVAGPAIILHQSLGSIPQTASAALTTHIFHLPHLSASSHLNRLLDCKRAPYRRAYHPLPAVSPRDRPATACLSRPSRAYPSRGHTPAGEALFQQPNSTGLAGQDHTRRDSPPPGAYRRVSASAFAAPRTSRQVRERFRPRGPRGRGNGRDGSMR